MTVFKFNESAISAFVFQPTLDGTQYTAIVTWNISGSRYYISLFALSGVRIFTLPLIGSPDGMTIESIEWVNGIVTVTTLEPHGYLAGATVNLTISGMSPDAYNGDVQALITGLSEFQFTLASDPGAAQTLGISDYNINIAAGYLNTSKLVFRDSSKQFEIL